LNFIHGPFSSRALSGNAQKDLSNESIVTQYDIDELKELGTGKRHSMAFKLVDSVKMKWIHLGMVLSKSEGKA
jgi:hypothetical protein